MKRALIALLLCLAAQPVHADHIWRLWCGNPLTPRKGSYDTSAECTDGIRKMMDYFGNHCAGTTHGLVWKEDGTPMASGHEFPNCRAAYNHWGACECKAEAVEPK
jgi:hypothetical protein